MPERPDLLSATPDSRQRTRLTWLFIAAAALGLLLAAFIARSSHEAGAASTPLIRQQLPLLEATGDLERQLLAIQAMNQQYFAYSINRENWLQQRSERHAAFGDSLGRLNAAFPGEPGLRVVGVVLENLTMLEPRLDAQMTAADIDWDEARAILVEMAIDSENIRRHLQSLRQEIATRVVDAGERTEASIARISTLVGAYSGLILIISLVVASHIRARARAERELAFNASHDLITGCYNRRALEQVLGDLDDNPHLLLVTAIERFHRLVAAIGHEAADSTLQALAQRLEQALRRHDGRVFRLDGAHFALLCPVAGDASTQASQTRMQHLLEEIAGTPLEVGTHELRLSLSSGCARYPDDGADPVTLLRNANTAQGHARQHQQALVCFSAALDTHGAARLALEAALGHAAERGELELFYQPQMALADQRIIGCEALLRWRRNGTLVSPADFIPAAEESGLIVAIGAWVLRTACRQARAWADAGLAPLVIAVNISARQFLDPGFMASVRAALVESGVDPGSIELEITESAIMADPEGVAGELLRLRALGVSLAIDDFGTGYSSLAYLRRFPLDKLKIDQSFVRGLGAENDDEDRAIVAAIIRLGQTLGLAVIAEGVETEAQRDILHGLGGDEIQGYWLSRPLPAEAASSFMQQHRA